MEAQAIRTQRDDGARQCIEAAMARRKDGFALSHVVWTADYGYIVKFRLGLDDVLRSAVDRTRASESGPAQLLVHRPHDRTLDRTSPPREALYRTDCTGEQAELRTPDRTSPGMDSRAGTGDTSSNPHEPGPRRSER
jgi:hypothetical protein